MRVKLKVAYNGPLGNAPVGKVMEMADAEAKEWLKAGYAEAVANETVSPDEKIPAAEKAKGDNGKKK